MRLMRHYCNLPRVWFTVKTGVAKNPRHAILLVFILLLILRLRLNNHNRESPLNNFPVVRETTNMDFLSMCLKQSDLKIPGNSGREGELQYAFSGAFDTHGNNDIIRIIAAAPNITEINFRCNITGNDREPLPHTTNWILRRYSVGNHPLGWVRVPNFKIHGTPEGHGELYLFSAYFDNDEDANMDDRAIVRIIATAPNTEDTNVTCHFFEEMGNLISSEEGIVRRLSNVVHFPYRGGFVLCPLKNLKESQVFSVSVSNVTEHSAASIPLKVSKAPANSKPKHEFAICVEPVFNYDEVYHFIQWVEFHRMMGITHFTFYNITMGPKVSCAVHALLDSDSLTLINGWGSAPMISKESVIFSNAQLTQVADCNLRYRGRAKNYFYVDFDEYIVPNFTLAKNYKELMEIVEKMGNNETFPVSQYIFRHAFFIPTPTKYNGDIKNHSSSLRVEDLILHSRVQRKTTMEPYSVRSKCLNNPLGILEPGVHTYVKLVQGYSAYNVPENLAYLHHYRKSLGKNLVPSNATLIEDTNGRSITDKLLRRVKKSMEMVRHACTY